MKTRVIRLAALAVIILSLFVVGLNAQDPGPTTPQGRKRVVAPDTPPNATVPTPKLVDTAGPAVQEPAAKPEATPPAATPQDAGTRPKLPGDVPEDVQANRQGQPSEDEAAVVPYYNNFLTTYYLGPEDVITVNVFGQDRYSRAGITIPPNGRISYPLISEGVFVAGRTTEQVAAEITKKLDEYIIDPKVTVFLDKAVSARYSVLGDVAQPGMRIMTRRLSVYEAVAEAGGVLRTGDKSKVVILRRKPDGNFGPIMVNLKLIERGQASEMAFLVPGDQVVVPGNKIKFWEKLLGYASVLSFARTFATGGL
ncbi:MAG: polysaccharide biosynthesis/export family protein [Pyrinomonadaceae bacterium]